MKKTIVVAMMLGVVAPPLAAQGFFKKLLQNAQNQNQANQTSFMEIPPVMFWEQDMGADSNVALQVAQYVKQHNLKLLSGDFRQMFAHELTVNGTKLYILSPDDDLCGAPAGAVALVSGKLMSQADVMSLPEYKAFAAQYEGLQKDAQATAAQKTQQQEQLVRDGQGGYETKLQQEEAGAYQQVLAQSIAQTTTQQAAMAARLKYASIVNSGFAKMTMNERCVWALGVWMSRHTSDLDQAVAAASQRAAAQNQSSALGFGGPAKSQPHLSFDVDTAKNTLRAAAQLQHQAFLLGGGTPVSSASTAAPGPTMNPKAAATKPKAVDPNRLGTY